MYHTLKFICSPLKFFPQLFYFALLPLTDFVFLGFFPQLTHPNLTLSSLMNDLGHLSGCGFDICNLLHMDNFVCSNLFQALQMSRFHSRVISMNLKLGGYGQTRLSGVCKHARNAILY